ncbi:AAA family ATPase [Candidatus Parcubacteria bacterium]|nr:AAA family ATPase [Candidatus Parcubacteria bacterium]
MAITKVVLTGGPCAGKTSVTEAVSKEYGQRVVIMPEVPSMLLNGGFPRPERDLPYSQTWLHAFQDSILPVQRNMEDLHEEMARQRGADLVLCDRGLIEGAAYVPGGLAFFAERFGINPAAAYARYDLVIHLESVATARPELWDGLKAGNPARYETLEQAQQREYALRDIWSQHPNWVFVPGGRGIKAVVVRVLELLSPYLDTEVEYKYVLPGLPTITLGEGVSVQQGYIVIEPGELRIRRLGREAFITVKGDGTHTRGEWERPLPQNFFHQLWPATAGRRIEKTRHYQPHGRLVLELDVYHGRLSGLVTVEVGAQSLDQLAGFQLPDWAQGAVDVTNDPRYKNKRLATRGLPAG